MGDVLENSEGIGKAFYKKMIFPVIFLLIFITIGIAIQSYNFGYFVFTDFFGLYFVEWIKSFNFFIGTTEYIDVQDVFISILQSWYYFFFLGGVMSLFFAVISYLFFLIKWFFDYHKTMKDNPELAALLKQGFFNIKHNNLDSAKEIYRKIRGVYNPDKDIRKMYYKKIISFYNKIIKMSEKK